MTETRGWRLVLARRTAASSPPPSSSRRRFAKRARRRRLRRAAPWLALLLVLALAGAAVAVVYSTDVLGVEGIEVTGVSALTPQTVRVAARVPRGTPLARLNPGTVAHRVQQLKPVRKVSVARSFPHTLVIRVEERTPIAVVSQPDGYTLLDADGVGYLPVLSPPAGLPVVRVADPAPGDPTTKAALVVLAALPPVLRVPLVALIAESPTRIRLQFTDNRLVVWGDSTQNAAKVRVVESQLGPPDKVLDVSAPGVVTER